MSTFYPTNTDKIKSYPVYLTSSGIYFEESRVTRSHGYSDPQWIQTLVGNGEILLDGRSYPIDTNTGLFIPANLPHTYYKTSDTWMTHWFSFNTELEGYLLEKLGLSDALVLTLDNPTHLLKKIEEIHELTTYNYIHDAFKISTLIYSFLGEILQINGQNSLSPSACAHRQLLKILNYIDQYYMMDISINELANFAKISPQYLCRLFKSQLNQRPFEYIRQVRINKSKSFLLQLPTPRIDHIAKQVGFHDTSYYSSLFKKFEKITPRQFVKLHQRGV